MKSIAYAGLGAIWLVMPCGCGGDETPDADTSRASEFGFQTSVYTSQVEEGKRAYTTYCMGCHGEQGDGWGEAARFLHPPPRNFQTANFKFSSTRSGRLPTDDDLRRTITEGLKGSAMPGWDFLPPRTVTALISYIKTFSPKWVERKPAPRIPFVTDPYRKTDDKSEGIRRGEVIYHGYATCWTCHPSYVSKDRINDHLEAMQNPRRDAFRKGLFESEAKPNNEGEVIYPPDFRRDFVRSGADVEDLYRSIAAGITGTAMPTWIDSMEFDSPGEGGGLHIKQADIWAVAYYVQSLILERPAKFVDGVPPIRDRRQEIFPPGERPVRETPDEMDETPVLDEDFIEE